MSSSVVMAVEVGCEVTALVWGSMVRGSRVKVSRDSILGYAVISELWKYWKKVRRYCAADEVQWEVGRWTRNRASYWRHMSLSFTFGGRGSSGQGLV